MKQCTACFQLKDISEFSGNAQTRDGKQYVCKKCNREYQREYYQKHRLSEIKRLTEVHKGWAKKLESKEKITQSHRRGSQKYHVRHKEFINENHKQRYIRKLLRD